MKILLAATLVLLVSGCLVRGDKSKAKVALDADEETPTAFQDCFDVMEAVDSSSELLQMKFKSCIINFGIYPAPSPLRLAAAGKSYQKTPTHYGSKAVKKFMDISGISCEEVESMGNTTLRFTFPRKDDVGHQDYEHVDVKCPQAENPRVIVNLSVSRKKDLVIFEKDLLHFDLQFGENIDSATYHLFDTDSDGVIKKHVKVRGRDGKEEVILDNYELQ